MAVLSEADRERTYKGVLRWLASNSPVPVVTKADIRAAIDATDTWIDTNGAAFNTALLAAFRNNATLAQKTVLFCAVAAMRVSQAFARSLFGNLD